MESVFLSATVDRACSLGASREDILEGCLLRAEILTGPSRPVPCASVYLASTRAAALSGNQHICADLAQEFDWLTGFERPKGLRDNPSLGDMLAVWLQFANRVQVSMRYTLTVDASRATLSGRRFRKASQPSGQADAWDISSWVMMLRDQLGTTWDAGIVAVSTYEPKAIRPDMIESRHIHRSDEWGVAIRFPSVWLFETTKRLVPCSTSQLKPASQELDLETLFDVLDYSDWPGTTEFARFLGFHPKALQREFAAKGLSCEKLKDAAQSRLAVAWLANPQLSVQAVGQRLGYRNGSALTRSFHRWFGCSPSDWRQDIGNTSVKADC